MLPYVLLIAFPIMYYCILLGLKGAYRLTTIPYQNSVIRVFFILFCLLLSLRAASVGIDTVNYIGLFHRSSQYSWKEWMFDFSTEKGFMLLIKLVRTFTSNEHIFMTVVSCVVLLPLTIMYERESKNPLLTIILFLILPNFAMTFSGLRQSIAIAISVPVYYFTKEKKYFKSLLCVFMCFLFHRSAVILLLFYPIYHMNLTRKKMVWVVPIIATIFVFRNNIFDFLLQVISLVFTDNDWVSGEISSYTMLYLFILLGVYAFIFVDENNGDKDIIGLRNLLVVSVIVQIFASVHPLAMRMNYYFLLFLPLLIPKISYQAEGKNAITCKIADFVFLGYFLYFYLDKTFGQESAFYIYPYVPFWAS